MQKEKQMEKDVVVDVKNVSKIYDSQSSKVRVLDKVNVSIEKGEFVGIVGDSGSLFVTHNMELTKYCSRVIVVKDGRILE